MRSRPQAWATQKGHHDEGVPQLSPNLGGNATEQQTLIDRSLGEAGPQRNVAVHLQLPFAAIRMLETTDLVLTMPARIADNDRPSQGGNFADVFCNLYRRAG